MCQAQKNGKKSKLVIAIVVGLFFYLTVAAVATEKGYVTKVIDGDSLVLRTTNGKNVEVRLYGIDSPEWNQPDAKLSEKYLKEQVLKKNIDFEVCDVDRYNRKVAIVLVDGVCINERLVMQGFAWVYPRYCKKKVCKEWSNQQRKAFRGKKGIWKRKKPVSPWQWRHK